MAQPVLSIYIGDDVSQQIQIQQNGLPIDLTGATAISISIANDPSQPTPLMVASVANSKVALTNAIQGLLTMTLTPTDTAGLLPVQNMDLDVVVTSSLGKQQTYRVQNGMSIFQRNT